MPTSTGKRIRSMRSTLGLSQGELARRIGIAQASLSELESGESKAPAAPTLMKLARVLNVSQEWLITGAGSPIRPVQPTLEESEIVEIWRALSPNLRVALRATAQAMLESQPKATKAAPFRKAK